MSKLVACAVLSTLVSTAALAEYPERLITIIVPFPPGGSVDPMARSLTEAIREHLGESAVILNQPGAAGTIGTSKVAKADNDGYTLGVTTVGPLTTQPHLRKDLDYDVNSFEYICRTHITPQVLAVPASSPYQTLADLVADARANPDKLSFSSSGHGSVPHLATLEFGKAAGFKWRHIPTKGDGDALNLALSGSITGWVSGVQTYSAMSTKLRALGLLESERSPIMPDIPTFKEQGYDLSFAGWGGLIAPKGTPPDVIEKLSDVCERAAMSPAYEKLLETMSIPQGYLSAKEFKAFVHSEDERYSRFIKENGITAQ
nr:tripartite tricarboxylate transporter substrate binding protein [Pseudomonas sp.]